MTVTKQQLLDAIADSIAQYPIAYQHYLAGNPLLLAQLMAIATMLDMVSSNVDVAAVEPFLKARDSTVLADAASRGILPLAKAARVRLLVVNSGNAALSLAQGRMFFDEQGRDFMLDAAINIPANGTAQAFATQHTYREVLHTITTNSPFYEIKVPFLDQDVFIESLNVADADGNLQYAPEYMVQPNIDTSRIYNVETNELRQMFVRFGAEAVRGYHAPIGTEITLKIFDTAGEVVIAQNSELALTTTTLTAESRLKFTIDNVLDNGSNPHTIDVLRILASYPALFDNSAVFLGNFDYVVRKFLPDLNFLSVWNERVEELVRPPSFDSVNGLFFSFVRDNADIEITKDLIRGIIKRADDSYRLYFVDPVIVLVPLTVSAIIAPVHDVDTVATQIENYLVANYGRESKRVSVGRRDNFNKQTIYEQLKKNIPALQDPNSDFTLSFGAMPTPLPEHWRYIDASSIAVNISLLDTGGTGVWN